MANNKSHKIHHPGKVYGSADKGNKAEKISITLWPNAKPLLDEYVLSKFNGNRSAAINSMIMNPILREATHKFEAITALLSERTHAKNELEAERDELKLKLAEVESERDLYLRILEGNVDADHECLAMKSAVNLIAAFRMEKIDSKLPAQLQMALYARYQSSLKLVRDFIDKLMKEQITLEAEEDETSHVDFKRIMSTSETNKL